MENYNIKYKNKKGLLDIIFSGQLTINNIDKITDSLRSNIKKPKSVNILSENVGNIDLTFIQLIYSIIKSGKGEGFKASSSIYIPEDLKLLLTNAGFSDIISDKK